MRFIKFRGKKIDWTYGETRVRPWVHGNLFITSDGLCNIIRGRYLKTRARAEVKLYPVLPETIGQWTGMRDKNNWEIYEGDVLEIQVTRPEDIEHFLGMKTIYGSVEYDEEIGKWIVVNHTMNLYWKDWIDSSNSPKTYRIVGNLYTKIGQQYLLSGEASSFEQELAEVEAQIEADINNANTDDPIEEDDDEDEEESLEETQQEENEEEENS